MLAVGAAERSDGHVARCDCGRTGRRDVYTAACVHLCYGAACHARKHDKGHRSLFARYDRDPDFSAVVTPFQKYVPAALGPGHRPTQH